MTDNLLLAAPCSQWPYFIAVLMMRSYKFNVWYKKSEASFGQRHFFGGYSIDFATREFVKDEKDTINQSTFADDYKTFIDKNEEELEKSFGITYNFQTHTRGLKVRGIYPSMEEAELRCKMLREIDPSHDVYVGPVGMWMPWEPEAYKTGRVEYMEEELNKLMSEKNKNESNAKDAFEQRVKESKRKAIEDNIKNAEKSGNILTQTIDKDGNLIGVGIANTQEQNLKFTSNGNDTDDSISVADIRNELFEGDNIVTGDTDHGQSELISGPFVNKKEPSST